MARGFREQRKREAARRRLIVLKWLLLIGGLLGLGWFAYATGSELARYEVRQLQGQIGELEGKLTTLSDDAGAMQSERDNALARLEELQRQYDRDVPTGEARELLGLLQEQLAAGVSGERLRFLIAVAGDPMRCDGNAEQKRFIVQTGLTRGRNDWVGFAGNTIIVRATGQPSTSDNGLKQAWFDETKPVTVTFRKIDGSESVATGVLPLRHAVSRGGHEYRFVLTKAEVRGFLQVTAERCDLPGDRQAE